MAILPPPPTRVTIILARAQGGTLLRVRHTRFGHSPDWARARSWHKRAWITCLDNLEAFLAGRPPPAMEWVTCKPRGCFASPRVTGSHRPSAH